MPQADAKVLTVIPARLESSRLARKLLLRETGKSLLQHTWENACRATRPIETIVAVDHPLLAEECRRFGAPCVMTSPDCQSGTDRLAEVAANRPEADVFVNVQGDEPELDPRTIDQVVERLLASPDAAIATIASPIREESMLHDPAVVKAVCNSAGEALYFSRSWIPRMRDWSPEILSSASTEGGDPPFLHHLGLYAYRRDFLLEFATLAPAPIERLEKLEQLRALWHGRKIVVGVTQKATPGIDTAADYQAFVQRQRTAVL
ncbi:MAG TPA: 3-deoxy-manno-octulosonate cytidylyltransferase [Pirellulaceae bacterium]|jgi:3-deoxy-manno-octulosonate cytidylyltransferase (CMP-KDO synthetase)|nr:3-deoxy-manno-octulosonate cytidylyltransferase [Pirellulaceae bacterium]